MKIGIFSVIAVVVLGGLFFVYWNTKDVVMPPVTTPKTVLPTVQYEGSVKNATYTVDGEMVVLKDGQSVMDSVPQSASKITTQYFGSEVRHDFNGDSSEDTAFIITQSTGGTGLFYYVVVALSYQDGYLGSKAYLLGDRIAPQTMLMSIKNGEEDILVVNYADRKAGEAFTTPPSEGKSLELRFDTKSMQLEIVK